uniref:C-type lectin domain-containing protein n=1 Tax=Cyprinus carpio carpio TaxID=630221 RepID=A0A9J7XT67_CYPCA
MEQRLMHLVLFSGFLSVILCDSRRLTEYVLIQEYKTWNEARNFCQKNYIDLATVQTDEQWSEINKLRAKYLSDTWIGLYDDVNSWRWSFHDEHLTYARWDKYQPDNYGGDQDCVILHSNGYWRDKGCDLKCVVVCQSDQGPVLVTHPLMSWKQAQHFCRENFIDLYTVKNESENQRLRMMNHNDESCIWIGLFRDSWKWSDQTNTSSSLRWAEKQPDNSFGSEICAAVDEDGWIADELCSEMFFFFCKSPLRVRRQILRLEVKAGDNVADQVTADAVLKEVQKKLREQGMAADVNFSWQEQPNGTVFQKLNKQHYRWTKGEDDIH